jgi:hypothetical protein
MIGTGTCLSSFKTKIGEFTGQKHLVNDLKKPRSEFSMYLDRSFEHLGANVVLSHFNNILSASAEETPSKTANDLKGFP